jgi:hypothetical protein
LIGKQRALPTPVIDAKSDAAHAGLAAGREARFCSPQGNDKVIYVTAMTRFATLIIVVSFCSNAGAAPLVTYESPCECQDNHGKHRWAEKNDPAQPPMDASAIQAVTPSDIDSWQGPTEYLVPSSERIWSEQKWYALTGRVVELRAEEDGDLHIALPDATGDKPGSVVVEIPAKPQWCEIRTTIFSWRCPKKDWKPLARERKPTL